MKNTKTELNIAKEELDRITAQIALAKEEIENWKVNTAPLAANEEIKELYEAGVITFNNLLSKAEPLAEYLTNTYAELSLKAEDDQASYNDISKFRKQLSKLDLLSSGLEAYLWVCKKDVKELTGENEWE